MERHTRVKASQIASIMPSDVEASNASSTDYVAKKMDGEDKFTWIPCAYRTKGQVDFTLYTDVVAETEEKFKFYEHSVDFNDDRAIYINNDETYVGHGAGDSNTTGSNNTFIGNNAGKANTTGYENTATGMNASYSNTEGNCNTANGYGALRYNTTGHSNTANGRGALYSNTEGNYNTANGMNALLYNTSGSHNTANGYGALHYNTTGNYNTANGYDALYANTTGNYNTANGNQALYANTTGHSNTAVGYKAGYNSTTVNGGIYLGYKAGENNTTANRLYMNNSNSAYPLIYGEFDNDKVKFGDNNAYWFAQIIHENSGGQLFLKECTTPTAQVNYGAIYTKADNKLYFQDGAGVEKEIAFV